MKLLEPIKVDTLPKNCRVCEFNQTKYCSALMCVEKEKRGSTFVQNNIDTIDKYCPLTLRNHGIWIEKKNSLGIIEYECSHCGHSDNKHTAIRGHYCWYCGAVMDEIKYLDR